MIMFKCFKARRVQKYTFIQTLDHPEKEKNVKCLAVKLKKPILFDYFFTKHEVFSELVRIFVG